MRAALSLLSEGPEDANDSTLRPVLAADWSIMLIRNDKRLRLLMEYSQAIDEMKKDVEVAKHLNHAVGTGSIFSLVQTEYLPNILLATLLERQGTLDFREKLFNSIYRAFEDYFYSNTLTFRIRWPVLGLEMEVEKIKLETDLSMVKLSNRESELLYQKPGSYISTPTYPAFLPTGYRLTVLELIVQTPKVFDSTNLGVGADFLETAPTRAAELEYALRLFKPGAVSIQTMHTESKTWDPKMSRMTSSSLYVYPAFPGTYKLSRNEVARFKVFWRRFKRARKTTRKEVETSLRRFSYSFQRQRSEDRLIDYMIALEAILVQESQELSYRLSMRGAALLGRNNADKRERVFNELRAAYTQRGKAVHGAVPEERISVAGERILFADFIDRIEEYVRSAIKEFLWRCETQTERELRETLDRAIVRGFSR